MSRPTRRRDAIGLLHCLHAKDRYEHRHRLYAQLHGAQRNRQFVNYKQLIILRSQMHVRWQLDTVACKHR